ncbi:MAG: 2-polyprenyl-3-methyl-5-hydroxy-6-metoxy-1,4-benzoquinol methylase [Polaribacter sp.]|jgi:2-polyprenyl-3-methyl-5-hydroxy-6-metoxy-1,4-benzoquinol methylase
MNNNLPVCPLCSSINAKKLESIKVNELDKLYHKGSGYSVKKVFKNINSLELCRCGDCDLQYFYPMVPGTEEFYENLQKLDWYYFDDKPEFDVALKYIDKEDNILEIGSGKGSFAKKLSSNQYTGLEFSQQAIKFAESNGVHLLAQSVEDYSIGNKNKHDVVCDFQVLEHVSDVNTFLSSSVTCLKPGGLMIISVPSANSFSRYVRNFWADMPPHHLTRWTDLALANIAKQYGLELLNIHHEDLQSTHKIFYSVTIFSNAIFSLFGKSFRNIDLSFTARILGKISDLLGKVFSKGLISDDLLPRGISVVAVYRKSDKG